MKVEPYLFIHGRGDQFKSHTGRHWPVSSAEPASADESETRVFSEAVYLYRFRKDHSIHSQPTIWRMS